MTSFSFRTTHFASKRFWSEQCSSTSAYWQTCF